MKLTPKRQNKSIKVIPGGNAIKGIQPRKKTKFSLKFPGGVLTSIPIVTIWQLEQQ